MGFLDDVKKDTKAETSECVVSRPSESAAEFVSSVQPTMHALERYLRRLADHLVRLDSRQMISYNLQGARPLTHLKQGEYGLSVDDPHVIRSIEFRYNCQANRVEDVYAVNKEAGERQQQYLWHHRLRFSTKKTTDERWHFKLEAFVPVSFEFALEPECSQIKLKICNHERLGVLSYSYDRDDINQLFLDELAKYIMRKSSRFHELSGDVLPDDTLQRLRQQVAEREAERQQERGSNRNGDRKGLFRSLFKR